MFAVLEHQENHLSPAAHRHVQEPDAARVGDPLQELNLPERGEREPVLLLVVQDHLLGDHGRRRWHREREVTKWNTQGDKTSSCAYVNTCVVLEAAVGALLMFACPMSLSVSHLLEGDDAVRLLVNRSVDGAVGAFAYSIQFVVGVHLR